MKIRHDGVAAIFSAVTLWASVAGAAPATRGAHVGVTLAVAPPRPAVGQPFRLVSTLAGDTNGAQAEWDDGTWDTAYAAVAPYSDMTSVRGRRGYKVRVRNAYGRVAEAVAWVESPAAAHGCSFAPGAADDDDDDDDDRHGGWAGALSALLLLLALRKRFGL